VKLRIWLGSIALGAFFVLLRWNLYNQPLVRDEGEYAYAGQLLKHGKLPYQNSFLQKPPMVAFSYALASLIAPKTFWFPRILAYACAAAATFLLGRIARIEFGEASQWPVMWLVTPMLLLPGRDQATANTEMFMILPLVGTVAIYVSGRSRKRLDSDIPPHPGPLPLGGGEGESFARSGLCWIALHRAHSAWFAAGVLAAITFWYKYTALPVLLVLFGIWIVEEFKVQGSKPKVEAAGARAAYDEDENENEDEEDTMRGQPGRLVFYSLIGAGVASLAIVGCFLIRDGGLRLWECTVLFNRYYAASESFDVAGFWSWVKKFGTQWWILLLFPLALALKPRRGRDWLWVGMFLAACVTTAMSHYGHYYIVVMPFWAILAGAGIARLAVWGARRGQRKEPLTEPRPLEKDDQRLLTSSPTRAAWMRASLTAGVLVVMCWPDWPGILHRPQPKDIETWPPVLRGSRVVAQRVAEMTSPGDSVLIAGSEPQILSEANRFSPTRFIIMYPLMIPTPVAYKYQREAMAEIESHRPTLIVFTPEPGSWLQHTNTPPDFFQYLNYLLGHEYEPVGGYLPSGEWKEPLSREEIGHASLQVYRTKNRKLPL